MKNPNATECTISSPEADGANGAESEREADAASKFGPGRAQLHKVLLDELQAAGWAPSDPSEECLRINERPAMRAGLSPEDVFGVHAELVICRVASKFARGGSFTGERARLLTCVGVWLALHDIEVEGGPSQGAAMRALCVFEKWRRERLKPACEKLATASAEEMLAAPERFEPAFTYSALIASEELVDVEGSLRAANAGVRLHYLEQGEKLKGAVNSMAELEGVLDLASKCSAPIRIRPDGKFELHGMTVKTALDKLTGRRRRKAPKRAVDWSEKGLEDPQAAERTERIIELRALQSAISERRARPGLNPAQRHVLDHFVGLVTGEMTIRSLAEKLKGTEGCSKSALDRCLQEERDAVRQALGG